jgi:hypothetical protein
MADIPDPGKSFEQALLDLFATGYSSGMVTALVRLGFDMETAEAAVRAEIRVMARDPAYCEEVLEMLRTAWTVQKEDPEVGKMRMATVHINPDSFT